MMGGSGFPVRAGLGGDALLVDESATKGSTAGRTRPSDRSGSLVGQGFSYVREPLAGSGAPSRPGLPGVAVLVGGPTPRPAGSRAGRPDLGRDPRGCAGTPRSP